MKRSILTTSAFVLLLTALGPSAASAETPLTAGGPTALAIAGVLAPYSPLLSASDKKVIAGLFDGNTKTSYPKKKLTVTADAVTCRVSNVAITQRSCELTFQKGKQRSLKGREANEVFATLATAGVTAQGAAGSMIESITKLSCTLDPAVIADNSGGGADCSMQADQ
jgi:hypothetical protein